MAKKKVKVKSLSCVQLFGTQWTVAYQATPSMGLTLHARILEWVAISFSRGSSQPKDQTQVFHIAGRFFILWAIREDLVMAKVQLNSVNGRMRSYVWFSAISVLCLQEGRLSSSAHRDSLRSFTQPLTWESESLSSLTPFLSSLCSVVLGATSQHHYIS